MSEEARCPKCNGQMYDERKSKFWGNGLTSNGKQKPIFKCKDKACGGVIWPPRNGPGSAVRSAPQHSEPPEYGGPMPWETEDGEAQDTAKLHAMAQDGHSAEQKAAKLNAVMQAYDVCFDHALVAAKKAKSAGYEVDMAGLNAAAATILIAAKERGAL